VEAKSTQDYNESNMGVKSGRIQYGWYTGQNHANSSAYLHVKTNLNMGAISGRGNDMYLMGGWVITGYGYGSSGTGGLALAKYQTDIHAIAASCFNTSSSNYVASNFGGYTTISISSAASDANGYGTFEYAPPSGYLALCTKNLASDGGSA
jgi:hypothetical protein